MIIKPTFRHSRHGKPVHRENRVRTLWPAVRVAAGAPDTDYRATLVRRIRERRGEGKHRIARALGVSWRTVTAVLR